MVGQSDFPLAGYIDCLGIRDGQVTIPYETTSDQIGQIG
jgi:hypothetical protein